MKEVIQCRGILFSGSMPGEILAGRKTQTRRGVQDVRHPDLGNLYEPSVLAREPGHVIERACPYGSPGDRLWVREDHYRFGHWEPVVGVRTKTGRQKWKFVADAVGALFEAPAGVEVRLGRHHKDPGTPAWHKRLGRFMPRELSRILLEIVSVRVERVRDISEGDAIAEGIERITSIGPCRAMGWRNYSGGIGFLSSIESYRTLWTSINGPGSWSANPWVWVVGFRVVSGER